jgi:hypothetical protein
MIYDHDTLRSAGFFRVGDEVRPAGTPLEPPLTQGPEVIHSHLLTYMTSHPGCGTAGAPHRRSLLRQSEHARLRDLQRIAGDIPANSRVEGGYCALEGDELALNLELANHLAPNLDATRSYMQIWPVSDCPTSSPIAYISQATQEVVAPTWISPEAVVLVCVGQMSQSRDIAFCSQAGLPRVDTENPSRMHSPGRSRPSQATVALPPSDSCEPYPGRGRGHGLLLARTICRNTQFVCYTFEESIHRNKTKAASLSDMCRRWNRGGEIHGTWVFIP